MTGSVDPYAECAEYTGLECPDRCGRGASASPTGLECPVQRPRGQRIVKLGRHVNSDPFFQDVSTWDYHR